MTLPPLDWDDRFAKSDGYLFGTTANYFLGEVAYLLPTRGSALAVADGEGRNGVWLARHGLDVTSVDVSPTAQKRAADLAAECGVSLNLMIGDAHDWDYPENAFDVVVEVFTQFSNPEQRARKWAGMRRALKPGGTLLIVGYRVEQLNNSSGGPRHPDHLYTADLLNDAFGDFTLKRMSQDDLEMAEGAGHDGMSSVIGAVWRKPE